jgi:nucleoid-associated protein YgaU
MPIMHLRLLGFALVCLLPISGCGDAMSRGLIITGDGKVGANNARNQRENAQDALRCAIEDDLGEGSSAKVVITEMPLWIEERAVDDGVWRWERITATVQVSAPVELSEAKRSELQDASHAYLMGKLRKKDPALLMLTVAFGTAGPQAPVAQSAGQRTYLVQPGDTLADISTAFYGSPQHWRRIADANPGGTAPGATIVIPPAASAP